MYKQQRGFGKGTIFPLILLGIVIWIGFKLFPLYMEQSKISAALESLVAAPEIEKKSPIQIRKLLLTRLGVNDSDKINNNNYKEFVNYERTSQGFKLTVKFQDEASLFGNLYLMTKFDKTIEAPEAP